MPLKRVRSKNEDSSDSDVASSSVAPKMTAKAVQKKKGKAGISKLVFCSTQDSDLSRSSQTTNSSQSLPPKSSKQRLKEVAEKSSKLLNTFVRSASSDRRLWVEKHFPKTSSDLVVHPKRVSEVRTWMQAIRDGGNYPPVLVLSGPSGIGKSTLVRVLAQELNVELLEYKAEVGISWNQHQSLDMHDMEYTSSVEEFLNFASRACRYGALPMVADVSVSSTSSTPTQFIFVEDYPSVHTVTQKSTFSRALNMLISGRRPCIFIWSVDPSAGQCKLPPEFVDNASVLTMTVRPVPPKTLERALLKIGKAEGCGAWLDATTVASVAGQAGDLRSAINSLQILAVVPPHLRPTSTTTTSQLEVGCLRDTSYIIFHALGKILYSKRKLPTEEAPRGELQFDPEEVLKDSYIDGTVFNCFLHQNFLNFFDDTDDVAEALDYLSCSDVFDARFQDRDALRPYASALSVRGFCEANRNAGSRRWQPLYKPQIWEIAAATMSNFRSMNSFCILGRQDASSFGESIMQPGTSLHTSLLPSLACLSQTSGFSQFSPAQAQVLHTCRSYSGRQFSHFMSSSVLNEFDHVTVPTSETTMFVEESPVQPEATPKSVPDESLRGDRGECTSSSVLISSEDSPACPPEDVDDIEDFD